jgi:hypothetical protein
MQQKAHSEDFFQVVGSVSGSVGATMGTYHRLRRTQEALSSPPSRVLHSPTTLILLWDENSFGSKHISRLEVKYAAVGESDRRAAHSPPPSSGTDGASRPWQWRPQEVHVTVKERFRARGGGGEGVSRSGGTGRARGEVRVALTGLRPGMVYKIKVRGVSGEGVRGCWSLPALAHTLPACLQVLSLSLTHSLTLSLSRSLAIACG